VGGKYPDAWHYEHMRDPRSTSTGSVMPPYPWLHTSNYDAADITASVRALSRAGTPYSQADIDGVPASLATQAAGVVRNLAEAGITTAPDAEIVALIAYLQRLGVDGRAAVAP
jgi:cytochrome c oxidase cbb3-type subunit I/II